MPDLSSLKISQIDAVGLETRVSEFSTLLHDCVHAGASVGFIMPHPIEEARSFWATSVLPGLSAGGRCLFVAEIDDCIVGTVQLIHQTPANQPHRADVSKLLVHPDFRRMGIAKRLMNALEAEARQRDLKLLTLDTLTGDSAEPLYLSIGFETTGVIPNFCIDTHTGKLGGTTIMYKWMA